MNKETLDRFAETLRARFHRVKWESVDDEFASETNRESWRSCAKAVIEEYQKWIEENIV